MSLNLPHLLLLLGRRDGDRDLQDVLELLDDLTLHLMRFIFNRVHRNSIGEDKAGDVDDMKIGMLQYTGNVTGNWGTP